MNFTTVSGGDIYSREVVMVRVGHLIRRKQEVERITRILRGCFAPESVLASEPGRITRIILTGPYARRTWYEDRHTLAFSNYEFWTVVNHPLFTNERQDELPFRRAVRKPHRALR